MDLDAIKRRRDAISSGTWVLLTNRAKDNYEIQSRNHHAPTKQHSSCDGSISICRGGGNCADGEFIVNARDDIDDLIAEVERLDNQRYEMVLALHKAVYGATWARTESPQQVWELLLDEVRRLTPSRPKP